MLSPPQLDPEHRQALQHLQSRLPHQLVLLLAVRPDHYWFWTNRLLQFGALRLRPRRRIDLPMDLQKLDPLERAAHNYWTDQALQLQQMELTRPVVRQIEI